MKNNSPIIPLEMQDLLTRRNNAIVAINRRSGGPQLSPVWYLWDGDDFYFRIATNTAKYANIKRDPSITLMISNREGYRYITVTGEAQILDVDSQEVAAAITRRYYAPERAEQMLMNSEEEPGVVTVRLRPERVVAINEEIAKDAIDSWS